MVTVEDFSHLVAGIYAAAAAPDHWVSAIGDINRALGGTGGSLLSGDRAVRSTIPREVFESYAKHYYRLDYVLAAVEAGPVGAVRTGPEVVVPNRKGEFYAGWMHPHRHHGIERARGRAARRAPMPRHYSRLGLCLKS